MHVHSRIVVLGAWLFAGLGAAPAAMAQSDSSDVHVYVCVGPDGQKTYTNTASSKSCKRLDIYPILSVPAPKRSAPASSAQPANFPRIDRDTQRARDSDRRQILEEELKSEQDKLTRLRAEYKNGEPERRGDEKNFARYQERTIKLQEDIQRAEANVNSLNRELAALRQ